MKQLLNTRTISLSLAPILLLITACSSHYSVSSHSHRHHRSHVSVGVHGHGGGEVLGALIVGGIIGHALSEASENKSHDHNSVNDDELVNGYTVDKADNQNSNQVLPEKNAEQNRFYQLGQDGNCYLMEKEGDEVNIVSAVPQFSC